MGYEGNDRRRHRVFTTRNTEYHVRDEICVAVRDRKTSRWQHAHLAVNRKVEGGVRIFSNGACIPNVAEPQPGDAIYFNDLTADGEERQIVTSRLLEIGRPEKHVVASYPSH